MALEICMQKVSAKENNSLSLNILKTWKINKLTIIQLQYTKITSKALLITKFQNTKAEKEGNM